ncbi:MAG TPA: Asp-tRNA(Asn)/Glu-tRNA(Gln) amidotransferase subunit GatA [Gammaproteobacteria bacterium]|nr:Asp-tRNA(Asn)/Glu-tRNA(Gln) amidotransferase subunit GatA [Gammaproteobacteria bacterium]
MHYRTLAQSAAALKARSVSSVELTKIYLERIARFDSTLNSFITVTRDEALAQAARADERIARGDDDPMLGVPIAHKDIFCTAGIRTTCGSRMLDGFVSPYDATVVERLARAGAVVLGKTNMDEFAMGSSSETSYYGPVRNPWDTSKVPGGSSGGSAAAVAAGLCAGATGTDTGGSIRQPAALSGLTGLKPTYGRVSRYGMIAFASSLDHGGTLTRTAEDAALMLDAMAGFDERDSTSIDEPMPSSVALLETEWESIRIGVPEEFFDDGLDPGYAACVHAAIGEIEKLGATVKPISMPNLHLSVPTYYVVAPAEASSNLARYDGIRFGHRSEAPCSDIRELYERNREEGFGAEVQRRILIGTYVLSAGYYDAYYLQAQKARQLIARDFARAFAEVDVIAGPTTPTPAFGIGQKTDDPVAMYLNDIYTIGADLAGVPALSIPCGFVDALPVGLQLVGPHLSEARLLKIAHHYQRETDWHLQTPEAFD